MPERGHGNDLERLATGEMQPAERRQVVRRWISAAAGSDEVGANRFSLYTAASRAANGGSDYAAVTERALGRLAAVDTRQRRDEAEAEKLLNELLDLPEGRQTTLVLNHSRYWTWSMGCALAEAVTTTVLHDPRRAVHLARLALEIAQRVDDPGVSRRMRADLLAGTIGELANALRVVGDLAEAEETLVRARLEAEAGTGDPVVAGRLLAYEVSLRNAQGRFTDALEAGRRGLACFRRVNDRHRQGRVLISIASAHGFLGDADQALATLERAAELIDFEAEPRLAYCTHHNRASMLAEAGCYGEAEAALRVCVEMDGRGEVTAIDHLLLLWLRGRVAAGLGRPVEAEELLNEARREFLTREMAFDAALVSLELAVLYTEQRRHAEVRRLAEEMVPVFSDREVHPEALAALKLFCDAARAEAVEVGLLREILAYLGRARGNPRLRFRG